ncbi:CitMHS family transporter [Alteromonas sp. AMM-1]|uniref:CitMHS family transporter n=1 Tax=Alteromonas sp. AMM-1 TaxID=3394233 RepID=UPI0039A41A89
MLALAGFITITGVLLGIMSKRLSPIMAWIMVPVMVALVVVNAADVPDYMLKGIVSIAPVAVMFMFAILFFGIMNDAGVFNPIISTTIRLCGNDIRKLFVGIVLITALVHLDGSGASTFLIVIPAVLPIFDALKLDRRWLACLVAMSAGVNNMLPWGGPTIRAAAALNLSVMDVYQPLLPIHIGGMCFVIVTAYWMGARASKALAQNNEQPEFCLPVSESSTTPWQWVANATLILAVIASIIGQVLHPAIAFIAGTLGALLINAPGYKAQTLQIEAHAKPAVTMVVILFAAGCFTGILRHSGMLDAMAQQGSLLLPEAMVGQLPLLVALLAMPLSLMFDPDSFYFGVLPVLSGIAQQAGIAGQTMAHSALIGQMTTGFPVSPLTPATFMLVGLTRINLADHQRFTFPYLYAISLFMTVLCVLTGVIQI